MVVAGEFTHGRVIILRGLANVFSRGMDKLAKDMKALGIPVLLSNHSRWQMIAADLIKDYKANPKETAPIIFVGHSLGGDASIVMANWLAQNGVPVRFIVIFDAVTQTHPVIGGVQEVLNFYKPKGYGQEVLAAPSFRGEIRNVDLTDRKDINHTNIDEDPVLQAEVTADVVKYLTGGGRQAKEVHAGGQGRTTGRARRSAGSRPRRRRLPRPLRLRRARHRPRRRPRQTRRPQQRRFPHRPIRPRSRLSPRLRRPWPNRCPCRNRRPSSRPRRKRFRTTHRRTEFPIP